MPDESALVSRYHDDYALHLPAMKAIPADRVMRPNLDIPSAAATTLAALTRLKALEDQMIAALPAKKAVILELGSRTRAMLQAHADYTSATTPPEPLPSLIARADEVRERFYFAGQALVAFGSIPVGVVPPIKTVPTHKGLAMDIFTLTTLFRRHWEAVERDSPLTLALLAEAESLNEQILTGIGERQQAGMTPAEATDLRDRAYTLYRESYFEVRRCLEFLRYHEEDFDLYLPSVFGGKRRGTRNGNEDKKPSGEGKEGGAKPQSGTVATTSDGSPNDGTEPGGPYAKG
jgi:hypothetical protein